MGNSKLRRILIFYLAVFAFYNLLPYPLVDGYVDESVTHRALAISICGITSFIFGFFVSYNFKKNKNVYKVPQKKNLYFLLLVTLVIKLISPFFLAFIVVAAMLTLIEIRDKKWVRVSILMLLVVFLFIFEFTRMYLLIYLLFLFFTYYVNSPKLPIFRGAAFLALSLALLIMMREHRSFGEFNLAKLPTYFSGDSYQIQLLKSIDTFHTYVLYMYSVRDYPDRYSFLYGSSLLKPIYAFIPRAIWENKPENLTNVLPRQYYGHSRGDNYSSGMTIIGEFYLNFGVVGVIVLSFIFGMISRRAADIISNDRYSTYSLFALSYISIFPSLMRGGINTTIIIYIVMCLIVLGTNSFLKAVAKMT